MREYHPEFGKVMDAALDILPPGNAFGHQPTIGVVVNYNCATEVHRDYSDVPPCIVFCLGRFEGGELCLAGPCGLVLKMKPGIVHLFDSRSIPHLTLPFTGWRWSFVCRTPDDIFRARRLPDDLLDAGLMMGNGDIRFGKDDAGRTTLR